MKKKKIAALTAVALVAASASLYLVWKKVQQQRRGDVPPAGAPQLALDNPGDQSGFPAAPSGEKDLG